MATDRDADIDGLPKGETDKELVLVRELIEALTAIGNYLAATNHMLGAEARPGEPALRASLEKGLAQLGRANEAARRLRALFRHDGAADAGKSGADG